MEHVKLQLGDWMVMAAFFVLVLSIGIAVSRRAGKNMNEFFLGGRSFPWWLAGASLVATSFCSDTPIWVTGVVRDKGLQNAWIYWSTMIGIGPAVFLFSRLWRRMEILTDLEFVEIRYEGKPASFLRGFNAIYMSMMFYVLVVAWVAKSMLAILSQTLDLTDTQAGWGLMIIMIIPIVYTALGGLRGAILADCIQLVISLSGTTLLAYFCVHHAGGFTAMADKLNHFTWTFQSASPGAAGVKDVVTVTGLSMAPDLSGTVFSFWDAILFFGLLWWPLAISNGYAAQRLMACKDERHSSYMSLAYVTTYWGVIAWPWILVALCSLLLLNPSMNREPFNVKAPDGKVVTIVHDTVTINKVEQNEAVKSYSVVAGGHTVDVDAKGGDVQVTTLGDGDGGKTVMISEKTGSGSYVLKTVLPSGEITTIVDEAGASKVIDSEGKIVGIFDAASGKIKNDRVYPFMLTKYLPTGLRGMLFVALMAAFMSTLSTLINSGSSYFVNDFYKRFLKPDLSQKEYVWCGRLVSVVIPFLGCIIALKAQTVMHLLRISWGLTVPMSFIIFLRFFWPRLTAIGEIAGFGACLVTVGMNFLDTTYNTNTINALWNAMGFAGKYTETGNFTNFVAFTVAVVVTVVVSLFTRPTSDAKLAAFVKRAHPYKFFWRGIIARTGADFDERQNVLGMLVGSVVSAVLIMCCIFMIGFFCFGNIPYALLNLAGAVIALIITLRMINKAAEESSAKNVENTVAKT